MRKALQITTILLMICQVVMAQTSTTFFASGTYIVPAGVTSITVQAWGGGGVAAANNAGSGGGAFVQSKSIPVTPGSSIVVTVGAGSSTNTSFGSFITAFGAIGQTGGVASTGEYVLTSFRGGNGGSGNTSAFSNYGGGGGAAGGPLGVGQNGTSGSFFLLSAPGGNGAISGGGSGGNGGSLNGNGSSGFSPGGGKGGKGSAPSGAGRVIVTYQCSSASTPQVVGNNEIIPDGDLTPSLADYTDFGEVGYIGGNLTRIFTLQNTGATTLRIQSIAATGADAALFAVQGGTLPRYVAAGTSTTFSVTFTPQIEGEKTAGISILMDNCNLSNYDFAIKGTGVCIPGGNPLVKFNTTTISDDDVTPAFEDSTNFGSVGFNGYSTQRIYKIQNEGTAPVRINGLNLSGPDAANFSAEALSFPFIIPAGGSKSFWVGFTPTSSGQKNAKVALSVENCSINEYDFAIRGTGICITADNPVVKGNQVIIPDGAATPSAVDSTDFGNVGFNGFSLNKTFTIINPGIKTISITGITFSGANPALFSVQNITFPTSIPAGDSATFQIRYAPQTAGQSNATVNIATDNCGIANYDFAVKGTGICDPAGAPKLLGQNRVAIADGDNSPSMDDLTSMGTVGTGGFFGTRTFIIQNPSPGPLTVNSITITGTDAAQFAISNINLPVNIPGNGEISFVVKLTPVSEGTKTATVYVNLTNCNIPLYDFAVNGTGSVPSSQVFNANGNFTALPGVTNVIVEAWGAGGRGAGIVSWVGGGGGAFVKSNSIPVSLLSPIAVTVGLGQNSNSFFGNSSFGNLLTANGGSENIGGAPSTGTNVAISFRGGNGGNSPTGNCNAGGGGGAAGRQGSGESGRAGIAGSGGAGGGGNGGRPGTAIVPFACSGTAGLAGQVPGGGGGGGYPSGANGANGRVIVTYACPGAGIIGTSHSIPYPPQLVPDIIQSFEGLAPTPENGLVYYWQQSVDTSDPSKWVPTKTPTSGLTYRVDKDSIQVKTFYRRVNNSCGVTSYSNVVAINVIRPLNGIIRGTVRSKNQTPVKGIKVYAQKVNDLPGSPKSWIDSATTADNGSYSIQRIYYGDPNEGSNLDFVSTDFIVRPFKLNHGFIKASETHFLTNQQPQISGVDFTDTTVYSITGRIIQECAGCLNSLDVEETTIGTVDSVEIFRDNSLLTRSGFIDGAFGRYAVTVTDPGTYKIEPRFKNHKFSPAFNNVPVENNMDGVDFKDTTTYTISGRLTAGCNDFIGTAELDFTDMLPNTSNGSARAPQFRKRITTNEGTGFYSIRLPAGKWKVSVKKFTPADGGDVQSPDLLAFFAALPQDSIIRNIDTANATLNLVYNRPTTLEIVGLDRVCTVPSVAIFEQSKEKTFTVKAWQNAAKTCPATDSALTIFTNIQKDDLLEEINLKTVKGSVQVKLKGGVPNIVAPYHKVLNLVYTDGLGRTTQLSDTVVVTGLKSNIGSFATVSPEVPIMILHDPPGDNSFSFWETTKSHETATRFYAASGKEASAWAEVKLGTAFSAGLGVEVETQIWGSVQGSVNVSSRTNNASESIISSSTTKNFSTAANDAVIGAQGDVFIGAALNLLYAVTNEVAFIADSCKMSLNKKLMIAPNGFATNYIYSEDHIRNTLLPTLRSFVANPGNAPDTIKKYQNQVKVWEQTLANNDANKKKAAFAENISFDGNVGPITSSTTTSSTKSNTIEFDLNINTELAIELGFEIGGSGVSGGVNVGFKMESGNSTTNTVMNATTIGYTLDDDDAKDFFSVNVKKDPVYNTPVFEMVAATTSCPYEPGSQPRDEFQIIVPQPVKTDIDPNGEAEFTLKISNTSQSEETRTYLLSFVQGSNPDGAVVTIGGSPALLPIEYTIDYLGEVNVLVKVKRGASNIFSYEGLQFRVTDACNGGIEKTARISAFFTPTCSPIELALPEGGWLHTQADNNVLPILFKGYDVTNTTSVTLEYQRVGANSWITGFTRPAAQLNNSVNGTLVNWDITSLSDGPYNLRMKLNCPAGVVNSLRSGGIIDRISPRAMGTPEPTDHVFVRGDQISIQYNEPLDCSGVTPSDVEIKRLSNGQIIPANVGCFQNKIVVVPITDISTWVGDSITVSVNNISDQYGNGKTVADKWRFMVGNTIPATGPRALTLGTLGAPGGGFPAGKSILSGSSSVMEDAGIPIKFVFELGDTATQDMLINYTVSGNGVFKKDYDTAHSQAQNLATVFNGATGNLTLKKGTKKIELSIIPIPNQQFEPNKTITITLAEGGDYELGAVVTATGTILNDDAPKIYIFTGSGNYNVPANWDNNIVPPSQVLVGDEVVIDPPEGGECILNVPVTVMPGARFEVKPGKVLRINNALQVKKKL
jgi:hypothetical protein